jgi:hypothetical protein
MQHLGKAVADGWLPDRMFHAVDTRWTSPMNPLSRRF